MKNTHLLKFVHDGFEIERPWRDCGASWNLVDPQVYGFTAFHDMARAVYILQRFIPGVGTLMLVGAVKHGVQPEGYKFGVHTGTIYQLQGMDGEILALATVGELDKRMEPLHNPTETRYALHVELAIPNSVADKLDRVNLDALADRMLATLEQGRQDNEFGIDMNWMAVIDIEPLGD